MNNLTVLEREILRSSHGDGMIPFPQGRLLEVERAFRMLENLARRGMWNTSAKPGIALIGSQRKVAGQLAAAAKLNGGAG